MRLQLLSDLHLEFHRDSGTAFIQNLDPEGVDILLIAGDLSLFRGGMLGEALRRLCDRYPELIFILGNHEFYGSSVPEVLEGMARLDAQISNLHWLENSEISLGGQRFLGSSLWFSLREDGLNPFYGRFLNDFHQIQGFDPWVYNQNLCSMAFLETQVRPGDVVLTHHIPDREGIAPKWRSTEDQFGRFFISQLPQEVLKKPRCWLFGHTHDSLHFSLGESLFFSNPFGYLLREENPDFDPRLILELR